MRKMRKIKLIAFLLSVTSCLFLLSTGFATWYNVSFSTKNVTGLLEVYDVEQMDSYISLSKDDEGNIVGFQLFEFTALGFKSDENRVYNTITATYDLNKTELEELGENITIESTLAYKNLLAQDSNGLFKFESAANKITVQVSYTINNQMKTDDVTPVNNGTDIVVSYTFEKGNLPEEFSIIYTFDITTDFRSEFGKYISVKEDNKTEFTTAVRIKNFSE